jgi:hypothetical protein
MPKDNCLSLSVRKGKVFHVMQPVAVLLALLLYKIDQGTISGLYIGTFIFIAAWQAR